MESQASKFELFDINQKLSRPISLFRSNFNICYMADSKTCTRLHAQILEFRYRQVKRF